MKASEIYDALFDGICKVPVIDTHEHLPWDEREGYGNDVLSEYLRHYLSSDLISSGLSRGDFDKVIDTKGDIRERWRIAEPYWEKCRYTGYGRALDIAARGVYGIDGIRRDTVEELNARFKAAQRPGHYREVLRELCGIETSLVDVGTAPYPGENELFKRVWQPRNFIMPSDSEGPDILAAIQRRHAISVNSLDDWLQALEAELDATLSENGVRILKCALAYQRTLRFEKADYTAAKPLFARVLEAWRKDPGAHDGAGQFPKELQDFMMHSVLALANARHLTIQFHTGLLEGNGNTLSNSDPSLLNNLFLEYPDVDFDLFHISYPYQGVACALAKMFPNVYIDMCWAHIISPAACVSALGDFLDAVPFGKISAFGGDYLLVDGVYGHLYLSRQNVSRALAEKVEQRVFGTEKALEIAKALYYDNPKRIFQLEA